MRSAINDPQCSGFTISVCQVLRRSGVDDLSELVPTFHNRPPTGDSWERHNDVQPVYHKRRQTSRYSAFYRCRTPPPCPINNPSVADDDQSDRSLGRAHIDGYVTARTLTPNDSTRNVQLPLTDLLVRRMLDLRTRGTTELGFRPSLQEPERSGS